ncbi:MAG: hypothetical protein ABEJ72_08075, partial [Candidatus Aenigmatarchaeota archaeon]
MNYLVEQKPDFDPVEMAFRLSAERNDYQPQQEITVYWDGSVTYEEEPAFLSPRYSIDKNVHTRVKFDLPEDQVLENLEDLVNDSIDVLSEEYVREFKHSFKNGECWIEMTTGRGKVGIGFDYSPHIGVVAPSDSTLG